METKPLYATITGEMSTFYTYLDDVAGKRLEFQRFVDYEWETIYEEKFSIDDKGEVRRAIDAIAPDEAGLVKYRWIYEGEMVSYLEVENISWLHEYYYDELIIQKMFEERDVCTGAYIAEDGMGDYLDDAGALGIAESPSTKIYIHPRTLLDESKWIAWHECGHIMQYRAYFESDIDINDDLADVHKDQNATPKEKDADCIAMYLSEDWNRLGKECAGNRGQVAYNIANGEIGSSVMIDEVFAPNLFLENTGFAVDNAVCDSDTSCYQRFERGTAYWDGTDDVTPVTFVTESTSPRKEGNGLTMYVKPFLALP